MDRENPDDVLGTGSRTLFVRIDLLLLQVLDVPHKVKKSDIRTLFILRRLINQKMQIQLPLRSPRQGRDVGKIARLRQDPVDQLVKRRILQRFLQIIIEAEKCIQFLPKCRAGSGPRILTRRIIERDDIPICRAGPVHGIRHHTNLCQFLCRKAGESRTKNSCRSDVILRVIKKREET